jgi:serine/threonine protein phosphatase PrpC
MGCGKSKQVEHARLLIPSNLVYPRQVRVGIKERNSANEVVKTTPTDCSLPPPVFVHTREVTVADSTVFVSACVLPGFDPKGSIPKSCQDRYVVAYDGQRLLAGAFDGHGATGHDCAQFISDNISRYFLAASEADKSDGKAFLVKMTEKVNEDLVRSPIETLHSGSTASMFMLDSLQIVSASVGDSRACLGTRRSPPKNPNDFDGSSDEEKAIYLEHLRDARRLPESKFYTVQLTKDSKPNDPDEMFRIFRSGGKVERAKRPNGQPFGPYRVLGKVKDTQGLAMSRSLGDTIYRDSGVISTPIVCQRSVDLAMDYFCVTGSDGIWDVMENNEVIDFVEACRGYSRKTEDLTSEEVRPHSCTIAQLLCEEARLRWLTLVQEEDVLVDDISAVVVELRPPAASTQPQSRMEEILEVDSEEKSA